MKGNAVKDCDADKTGLYVVAEVVRLWGFPAKHPNSHEFGYQGP